MWVNPSQLIPNCILLSDILGKTGQPIIPENTVLTEEHIKVIKNFLVKHVKVSPQLETGQPFIPAQIKEDVEEIQKDDSIAKEVNENTPEFNYFDHYENVVTGYKQMFNQWQNGFPIDMPYVRQLLIPLLERIDDIGRDVYLLHHYATKEDYFFHHCVAVGILSAYLAKEMGFSYGDQIQIGLAGFLCDSGMSKLNARIFFENRKLMDSERKEMQQHPTYSYRLVEKIPTMTQQAKLAILQHHERMDESGYPFGLSSEKIHMFARIIAVCDMYHAMTSDRSYRKKQSPFQVVEELQTKRFSQLDPAVVQRFIEGLTNFSIGTKVQLSNEQIGEIVFIQPKKPTRPIVRLENKHFISLEKEPNLFIKKMIVT